MLATEQFHFKGLKVTDCLKNQGHLSGGHERGASLPTQIKPAGPGIQTCNPAILNLCQGSRLTRHTGCTGASTFFHFGAPTHNLDAPLTSK